LFKEEAKDHVKELNGLSIEEKNMNWYFFKITHQALSLLQDRALYIVEYIFGKQGPCRFRPFSRSVKVLGLMQVPLPDTSTPFTSASVTLLSLQSVPLACQGLPF
jgi:hypothetical protein